MSCDRKMNYPPHLKAVVPQCWRRSDTLQDLGAAFVEMCALCFAKTIDAFRACDSAFVRGEWGGGLLGFGEECWQDRCWRRRRFRDTVVF
jgi:hypothetical protein